MNNFDYRPLKSMEEFCFLAAVYQLSEKEKGSHAYAILEEGRVIELARELTQAANCNFHWRTALLPSSIIKTLCDGQYIFWKELVTPMYLEQEDFAFSNKHPLSKKPPKLIQEKLWDGIPIPHLPGTPGSKWPYIKLSENGKITFERIMQKNQSDCISIKNSSESRVR